MKVIKESKPLGKVVDQWREQGNKIAFIPTMGNLHEGHLSLVAKGQEVADKVLVSIYVNPMQFGINEDFDAYPRTLDEDSSALRKCAVDGLFLPTSETIYPRAPDQTTKVEVPGLSDILCGEFRPGHFAGVTTVVCKLLNLVKPDVLILGEKDYQQAAIVRRMAQDLFFAVQILTGATIREPDGLAKSSRNQYLSIDERQKAPILYETMCDSVNKLKQNGGSLFDIESTAKKKLIAVGFDCEYYEFRQALSLNEPQVNDSELILLAAVRLGKTRLIDNIAVTLR